MELKNSELYTKECGNLLRNMFSIAKKTASHYSRANSMTKQQHTISSTTFWLMTFSKDQMVNWTDLQKRSNTLHFTPTKEALAWRDFLDLGVALVELSRFKSLEINMHEFFRTNEVSFSIKLLEKYEILRS